MKLTKKRNRAEWKGRRRRRKKKEYKKEKEKDPRRRTEEISEKIVVKAITNKLSDSAEKLLN